MQKKMSVLRFFNQLSNLTTKHLKGYTFKPISSSVEQKPMENGTPDKLFKEIKIEVRGNDPAVLKSYSIFTLTAAKHLEIKVGSMVVPKKPVHQRLTLLKSKHVHKKHRVQYEMRTYYRLLTFFKLTGSTADTFLEYIQRNLPEGVAMKVTKTEISKLPDSILNHYYENS